MNCHNGGLIKSMAFGLLVSITTLVAGTDAQANHPTNRDNFTNKYGAAGNWEIFHGDADTCVADAHNGQVSLRIKYTDYTGDMQIGMPYYVHQNTVVGDFGFSRRANISIDFDTTVISGWAMTYVDQEFERKLRREAQIGFVLDRGLQMFSLRGSKKAINMLKKCAKNAGVKPRKQAAQNNVPKKKIKKIQGSSLLGRERHYADVRGWRVNAIFENNVFNYCGATVVNQGQKMRIAHGAGKWGIGLGTFKTGTMYGQLSINYYDGKNVQAGLMTYVNDGDGWAAAGLNLEFVNHLKQGANVSLEIGDGFKTFSLSGSTAAMLKVEECTRNQGRQASYIVAPQIQPQKNVQNNTSYLQARKTTLSGIWVWTDFVKNSNSNKIVSKFTMTGNTSANYCYGFLCWDVVVQMQPDNSIRFTTDGVDHFEFWEIQPNMISGRFWEKYNSRSAVDATVLMQ